MFDETDKVSAYVKQKNIGMKIDYSGKARRVLKESAPQSPAPDEEPPTEELDGASRAMRRIIQQKLLNGDELMADEMRFLKRFDSGLYTKARAAQDAREALVQKLETAASKEEASEAFLIASGLVNEAGNAARRKDTAAEKAANGSPAPSAAKTAAHDMHSAAKPRTRWKLDLTDTATSAPAAKTTTTKAAVKTAQPTRTTDAAPHAAGSEKRTGSAPPPKTSSAFVQQPEDTTGIEFIMARALQSAWAKFTQTPKYRDLTSTAEHSVENLDPASMSAATRFFSASRAYRNLPKPRKGVPMQSFDSET
ncbi:hypothetical protein [Selenomonas sp.]|uniref:hypothetical protein n=1 Tax=Selenomonas sp. TaxID=2053611 RepID=UPI003FA20D8F